MRTSTGCSSRAADAGERERRRTRRGRYVDDARGRRVTYLDPYELQLLRRRDVIPGDTLAQIAAEVGFGLPRWQRRGYVTCVFVFFSCVIFLIIWKIVRRTPIDSVEYVLWPMNLVVFAFGAAKFWQSGRRARAKRVCKVMLDHRRCPHCGYDIRGLPIDPTGEFAVCPECGCAWSVKTT